MLFVFLPISEYIGCFKDTYDRDLADVLERDYDDNTPQKCINLCINKGMCESLFYPNIILSSSLILLKKKKKKKALYFIKNQTS